MDEFISLCSVTTNGGAGPVISFLHQPSESATDSMQRLPQLTQVRQLENKVDEFKKVRRVLSAQVVSRWVRG